MTTPEPEDIRVILPPSNRALRRGKGKPYRGRRKKGDPFQLASALFLGGWLALGAMFILGLIQGCQNYGT